MLKRRDFEHRFKNDGVAGSCHIRVYGDGKRPVVVATQERAPQGASWTSIIGAAPVIAADLIKDGTLSEFHISHEVRTESVQGQSLEPIVKVAPFIFVEEYLAPEHKLAFLWFDSYEILGLIEGGEVREQIGNPYREDTTRDEVETLIGASLDDDSAEQSATSEETQNRLRVEIENYFRAYYSTLRDQIAAYHEHAENTAPQRGTHGFASTGSVPDFYRSAKDVRTFFCNDGVAVIHYPARTPQRDTYSFEDQSWAMVQGVIRTATPRFPNGDRVTMLMYEPGEDFGANTAPGPQEVWDPGPEGIPAHYSTKWTRLDWAHKDHLDRWKDPSEAQGRAREDLRHYIPGT